VSGDHILALSGGVGGAKLAAGLAAVLPSGRLTVVVNTGDDFEHLGLTICPDIDSVIYALAGLNDTERGWGVADESWQAMAMLSRLGEADWFNLGDRDLAMHLARSWRLRAGESLSAVTARLTRALGIAHRIAPMSDGLVRTQVDTDAGWIDFQHYFVEQKCEPVVKAMRFAGTPGAPPSPAFRDALERSDLAAVIICPSNPFLSVDPILAVDGVRTRLAKISVPRIAVSPLVGGKAVKGPLSKLLAEIGSGGDNMAIARHYDGLIDHIIIDASDADDATQLRGTGLSVTVAQTMMRGAADRNALAGIVMQAVDLIHGAQ
jgi:LPPG:FO 2-phospho-L-lactate transferase